MTITSGAAALTVFQIEQPMAEASAALTADRLPRHSFRPIDDLPEPLSVGWTSFEDMLDTAFTRHPHIGAYLCFALRIDKRAVPPAVLKKHLALALREEEARNRETGKKFISRARKKELREHAALRLLMKAEPVPASHEVVVNIQSGRVLLGSASASVGAAFAEAFTRTFALDLAPCDSFWLTGDQEGRAGRAFLTRVFCESMTVANEGGEALLSFVNRVAASDARAEITGASRDGSNDMREVEAGVAAGKEVTRLGLCLEHDVDTWTMTLDQDLRITGLRLPGSAKDSLGPDDDPDGALLERIFLIERAVDLLHAACRQAWEQPFTGRTPEGGGAYAGFAHTLGEGGAAVGFSHTPGEGRSHATF